MVGFRDLMKNRAGDPARSKREPRDECNLVTLAIIHSIVPFAIREAVTVLHGNDGNNFASPLDVFLRDVRESDAANLTFFSQLRQGLNREIKRHDRIRSMQMVDVDTLQSKSL